MLAVVGHIITTAGVRLPGSIGPNVSFNSVPAGLKAFNSIPWSSITLVIAVIGLLEVGFSRVQSSIEDSCVDEMNERGWSDDKQRIKASIELSNGRAAQIGILALMIHEELDNDPYVINAFLGFPVSFNS